MPTFDNLKDIVFRDEDISGSKKSVGIERGIKSEIFLIESHFALIEHISIF
jgi:hypothetical protein